ncbi:hypothetical protein PS710_02709 [Pseudomonas fluorescens]|uniref:Uncharacterized protein n=1 Tax=Pseudomonas fluorescens TaxID=294 RepID=A0A5E7CB14_PSEFL|nr:hypothetical protein PS710_02709 [Pseudomonas fluorescens]
MALDILHVISPLYWGNVISSVAPVRISTVALQSSLESSVPSVPSKAVRNVLGSLPSNTVLTCAAPLPTR